MGFGTEQKKIEPNQKNKCPHAPLPRPAPRQQRVPRRTSPQGGRAAGFRRGPGQSRRRQQARRVTPARLDGLRLRPPVIFEVDQNECGGNHANSSPGRATAPPCSPPSLSPSPTPPSTPPALLTLPRQPQHLGGVNFLASAGNTNQTKKVQAGAYSFFSKTNF